MCDVKDFIELVRLFDLVPGGHNLRRHSLAGTQIWKTTFSYIPTNLFLCKLCKLWTLYNVDLE